MRYAARIEYNGSAFHGWQRQTHDRSVQATLEAALSRVADEPVAVVCAGRTDTGVHGLGQIVHFDSNANRSIKAWVMGSNTTLPHDVAVTMVSPVSDDFHARYSALSRRYRYIILNAKARSALWDKRATWIYQTLDISAMSKAASYLLGKHDFSAFRAAGCQAKSPVRELMQLAISSQGTSIYIDIMANAFLHNMVRIIVGTLLKVGRGEVPPDWVWQVLESRDRTRGGMTAPAHGLYFMGPTYPEVFNVPVMDVPGTPSTNGVL